MSKGQIPTEPNVIETGNFLTMLSTPHLSSKNENPHQIVYVGKGPEEPT